MIVERELRDAGRSRPGWRTRPITLAGVFKEPKLKLITC